MEIKIVLSGYMFPFLLALFKAMHWDTAVQWWRAVSKRHYSHQKVSYSTAYDAKFYINLYWLRCLFYEPKNTVVTFIKIWKWRIVKEIKWALNIFVLPYILAYLCLIAWILPVYIWVLDRTHNTLPAFVLAITPEGLIEAICAYYSPERGGTPIYKDIPVDPETCSCWACQEQRNYFQAMTIHESGQDVSWATKLLVHYAVRDLPKHGDPEPGKSFDVVLAEMAAAGLCTIEPGGTEPTLLKSQPMTEAEQALCQAINDDGPVVSLDAILGEKGPYYDSASISLAEQALCDAINNYFEFVPL